MNWTQMQQIIIINLILSENYIQHNDNHRCCQVIEQAPVWYMIINDFRFDIMNINDKWFGEWFLKMKRRLNTAFFIWIN